MLDKNVLTEQQLNTIPMLAEGLSQREVLDYYGLEFDDLSAADQVLFKRAYNQGRINMKLYAIRALKQSMTNSKTGMAASLAALSQLSDQWTQSQATAAAKSFRITLDPDD